MSSTNWFGCDEFSIDGAPDSLKWQYENGFVRNEEALWYQPKNAIGKEDYLVITGKKERKANPNYVEGSADLKTKRACIEYTSDQEPL